MSYNAFPFALVFLAMVPVWIGVAAVADRQRRKLGLNHPRVTPPLLKYALATAVLWILGLHFVFGTVFLTLYLVKIAIVRKEGVEYPRWLRRTAGGSLAALLAVVPVSYVAFPRAANEVISRERATEARHGLKEWRERLVAQGRAEGRLPNALPDGPPYDPFDYVTNDKKWIAPVVQWKFFEGQRPHHPVPFNYVSNGEDGLVWSRGPNGAYDISAGQAASVLGTSETQVKERLIKVTYDATNGTLSFGDIFEVVAGTGKIMIAIVSGRYRPSVL